MKIHVQAKILCGVLLLALAGMPAWAQPSDDPDVKPPGAVGYDTDRGLWLFDTDGDTFPDLTEEIGGTDPLDSSSNPLKMIEAAAVGQDPTGEGKSLSKFQFSSCRPGFKVPNNTQPWARQLCISDKVQPSTNFTLAVVSCRVQSARVCSYEDLVHVYFTSWDTDSNGNLTYNSYNKWLGDWNADDIVNIGNFQVSFPFDPDIWNFEGYDVKWNSHPYWCCHDLI